MTGNALALWRDRVVFAASNFIPRRQATRLMAWFSRIEHPLVRDASLAVWRRTADLRLDEAAHTRFRSLHDCFTRALRPGARPICMLPDVLASPCDGIVGAHGIVDRGTALQVKGRAYGVAELLADPRLAVAYEGGTYVTLRLKPSMYHRFHAPGAGTVRDVTFVPGDTWNVNPATLQRVSRVFCRNERAVLPLHLDGSGHVVTLVPVAAILVASLRLHCIDTTLDARVRHQMRYRCEARYARGDEMGWFEHGSTVIVFAPVGASPMPGLGLGTIVRMGEPLLSLPAP